MQKWIYVFSCLLPFCKQAAFVAFLLLYGFPSKQPNVQFWEHSHFASKILMEQRLASCYSEDWLLNFRITCDTIVSCYSEAWLLNFCFSLAEWDRACAKGCLPLAMVGNGSTGCAPVGGTEPGQANPLRAPAVCELLRGGGVSVPNHFAMTDGGTKQ